VHTDAKAADSARAVNALAYTVGHHVVFGTGQFVSDKSEGKRLIAHELAHTIQQKAHPIGSQYNAKETDADGPMELAADRVANAVLKDSPLPLLMTSGSQRIQRKKERSSLPVVDWRALYKQCCIQVFGTRERLSWGGRRVPPLNAVDLILQVTGAGSDGYGPEDLATVWAIETNFTVRPTNGLNKDGSVDIGPVHINYEKHSPGMSRQRKNAIFGTNLEGEETFNGNPEANLRYGWWFLRRRGHLGYNPGSKARAGAVKVLLPELRQLFRCILSARTIIFSEAEAEMKDE